MTVSLGTSYLTWAGSLLGKVVIAVVALLASLLACLTYHIGYPEFRS